MAFRSVHPFLRGSRPCPTDRQTDRHGIVLCLSVCILVVVYKTPLQSEDRITLHKLDRPNMVNKRVHL